MASPLFTCHQNIQPISTITTIRVTLKHFVLDVKAVFIRCVHCVIVIQDIWTVFAKPAGDLGVLIVPVAVADRSPGGAGEKLHRPV